MNLADEIRRLKQRLDNQISLREFGAVMDGATDDLPQVQAMITMLGALPLTLLVSASCYVSANVTIPSNIVVCFEGNGAFVGPGVVTYTPWNLPAGAVKSAQLDPALKLTGGCSARYVLNAAQTLPASAVAYTVNFDTKIYDSDNAVTTGSNWFFTCPAGKGGLYHVDARISTTNTLPAANLLDLHLYKNGAEYQRLGFAYNYSAAASYFDVHGGCDVQLAAGDTLKIVAAQSSGVATVALMAGDNDFFSIHRVLGY